MNQPYILFLDDQRFPPSNMKTYTIIARSYDDAVSILQWCGVPSMISFDHDLGEEKTGYDFAKYFCEQVLDGKIHLDLQNFDYVVHSQNPVGSKNIEQYMDNFLRLLEENENGSKRN